MKLTVHIGSHKAGSTAIQQICSREAGLLEAAGVYYPAGVFPNYPNQHSELNQLLRSGSDADVAAFIDRIHGVAKTKGLDHVFLSGEDLCSGSKPTAIERLATAARLKFDDVVVALVLRNKAAYLVSHYNHFLRHSAHPVGLADFRKSIGFSPRRTIAEWAAVFGRDAVRVVAYDSQPGEAPMVQRFFREILGVELSDSIVKGNSRLNASFDMLSALFINEALKTLPGFDLSVVNLAYIDAFRNSDVRMPAFDADLAKVLNEAFSDEDWQIDELPRLCDSPSAKPPLTEAQAKAHLDALAEFFTSISALYGDANSKNVDRPARRGEVVAGYVNFLGRAPSLGEVNRMTQSKMSMRALRQMFVESSEFRRLHREKLNVAGLDVPPLNVNIAASEDEQQAMFRHLQRHWVTLGKERPHWSVWSEPEFSGTVTPKLEADFYETGAKDFHAFEQTLARAGRSPGDFRCLVEFGCGLGRFTIHAARKLPQVVGIDFSASHIATAQAVAAKLGLANVRWIERRGLGDEYTGDYDLWYSRIVLQHNPPSLIDRLLRNALKGLATKGIAVFQVPTYAMNYSFDAETYLRSLDTQPDIEMHCFPQRQILRLLEEMSCRVLEIREDNSVNIPRYWVSNTFVVEKIG